MTCSPSRCAHSVAVFIALLSVACSGVDPGAQYVVEGVVRAGDTSDPINGLLVDCGGGAPVVTGGGSASVADGGVVEGCGEADASACVPGHFRCAGGGLGPEGEWTVRVSVVDPTQAFADTAEDVRVRADNTSPPPTTQHDMTVARP